MAGDARALEPFVGMWEVEARFPALHPPVVRGTSTFGWLLGRHFLVQRAQTDHSQAPDSETFVLAELDFERLRALRGKLPSLANRQAAAYRWPSTQSASPTGTSETYA